MAPHVRVQILRRLTQYVDPESPDGADAEPRTVITAARTLLAADKLNLEQERLEFEKSKQEHGGNFQDIQGEMKKILADRRNRRTTGGLLGRSEPA